MTRTHLQIYGKSFLFIISLIKNLQKSYNYIGGSFKMTLTKLLASDGYICLNKSIIKTFGIATALILGELCSEYNYWEARGEIEDGFFFSTLENLEKETTIKRNMQQKVFDLLKQYEVIEVKRKNMPARRYVKINEDKLFDFLQMCNEIKDSEIDKTEHQNITKIPEQKELQFTLQQQTGLHYNNKLDYTTSVNYINNNKYNKNNINNKTIDTNVSIVCSDTAVADNSDVSSNIINTNTEEITQDEKKQKPYKLKKIKTEQKTTKNKKLLGNINKQFELIDIYFNNGETCNRPDIASLIKQHLQQRIKKIGYKNYSDTRWENQLKLLIENSEGDYEYMTEIIKTSILRDYNDLTFPDQKKSLHKFKPQFNSNNNFDTAKDNVKNKGTALFTPEEKETYKNNMLATDENGNPIEF